MTKLYFVTDEEVPVPEDFLSFSGFLSAYENAMVKTETEEDSGNNRKIPLTVPAEHLRIIFDLLDAFRQNDPMEYARLKDAVSEDQKLAAVPEWASQFFGQMDRDTLILTMNAAGYLCVRVFLDYSTTYLARRFDTMSVDGIRAFLNLEDDFSAEEWVQLRKENAYMELFKTSR